MINYINIFFDFFFGFGKFLKNSTYNCLVNFLLQHNMIKKRLIVNYENLPTNVVEALNIKYPDGFENHIIKVDVGPTKKFHAVTVDYNDTSYLVKVNVSIDSNLDEFEDNEIDDDIKNNDNNILTGLEEEPSTEDEDVIG